MPYTKTDWVNNQIITETLIDHLETQYEQAVADSLPRTGGTLTGQLTVQGNVSVQGDTALSATGTSDWKTTVGLILHRSRYFGTYSVIGDQQDILALANREPNRTFTASPGISGGSLNSVLTDDMAFAVWNTGTTTPIVLTLDASANPISGAGFSSFGFTVDETTGYSQPSSIKIEAFNSGAYETVYNSTVSIRDGFAFVSYFLMTGSKINGSVSKLRVTFNFSPTTLTLPFRLHRMMLYNEGAPFSPFYLHRLGGSVFGNVTVYGTLNATTLLQNGSPVGGGGGSVTGTGTQYNMTMWNGTSALANSGLIRDAGGTTLTWDGILTAKGQLNVGATGFTANINVIDGDVLSTTVSSRKTVLLDMNKLSDGGVAVATAIGLFFGYTGPIGAPFDVGIVSKRTSGGNQNGLDIFTGSTARVSILSGGNVGIGNSSPGVLLELGSGNLAIGNASAYMTRDSTSTRRQIIKMSAGNELMIGTIDTPASNGAVSFRVNFNEYLRLETNGSVIQNSGAVATNATDGFMYIAGGTGTPTGTPTAYSGRYPLYIDGTNNLLYFYANGAWRGTGGTGGTDSTKVLKSGDTMSGNLLFDNGAADGADIQLASSGFTNWNLDNFSGDFRLHRGGQVYFTATPTLFTVRQGLIIDNGAANTGALDASALRFGGGSGEGIASKRNSGGNQSGLDFYTSSTARVSITNGGDVGIGGLPSSNKLDVYGAARVQGALTVQGGDALIDSGGGNTGSLTNSIRFGASGSGEGIASKRNAGGNQSGIDLYTNFTARLQIANGGNVGIGTAPSTAYKLDVNGDQRVQGTSIVKGPQFDVRASGAVGDARYVADGSITSGSASFTSNAAAFTAADVGKTIAVGGAGASGGTLVTTIQTYNSATNVTLAATASTTVAALASPAAPTLGQIGSGGSVTIGLWFVCVSAWNAKGESLPGPSTSINVTANNSQITVSIPAITGATGYAAYIGPSTGANQGMVYWQPDVASTSFNIQFSTATGAPLNTFNTTGAPTAFGTENTAAIQAAIDAAAAVSGTALLPGQTNAYLCTGTLIIKNDVTLHSGGRMSPSVSSHVDTSTKSGYAPGNSYNRGAELWTTQGWGSTSGTPFVTMYRNSTLSGVSIFYPNQVRSNAPVAYPYCIAAEDNAPNVGLVNVMLVNPYQGVDFDNAQRPWIDGLYGQPIYRGLYLDHCYDSPRLRHIHFWCFWTSGLFKLREWTKANSAEAFKIGRADGIAGDDWFCWGYVTGLAAVSASDDHGPDGYINGLGLDDVNVAILFEAGALRITNTLIYAVNGTTPVAIKTQADDHATVQYLQVASGHIFSSGLGVHVPAGSTSSSTWLVLDNILFRQWGSGSTDAAVRISSACNITVVNSSFLTTTGYQVDLGSLGAASAGNRLFSNCTWAGGQRFRNTNNNSLSEGGNLGAADNALNFGGGTGGFTFKDKAGVSLLTMDSTQFIMAKPLTVNDNVAVGITDRGYGLTMPGGNGGMYGFSDNTVVLVGGTAGYKLKNQAFSADLLTLTNAGSLIQGGAALATSATDGFLYQAGGAGPPTGTPTSFSGRVPRYVDTTNHRDYFYSGGAWRSPTQLTFTPPPVAASWTWVNQGGATVTNVAGGTLLTVPGDATADNFRALVVTVPTAPYTLEVGMTVDASLESFMRVGVILRNSTSGNVVSLHQVYSNGETHVERWNSPTSLNATVINNGGLPYRYATPLFLRIQDDNTNRILSASMDGITWRMILTEARTTFITPNQIGIWGNTGLTKPLYITINHWKVT